MVGSTTETATDYDLIQSLRAGEDAAAAEIYHRYVERLRKVVALRRPHEFAARFDADDVLQSVFLRFFKGIQSLSLDVDKDEGLWALLFVLTVNRVEDQRSRHCASKRSVYRTKEVTTEDEDPSKRDSDADIVLKLTLEQYLGTLPDPDRMIVTLRLAGYPVSEIAAKIGHPLRSVERILQTTRSQLADMLRD